MKKLNLIFSMPILATALLPLTSCSEQKFVNSISYSGEKTITIPEEGTELQFTLTESLGSDDHLRMICNDSNGDEFSCSICGIDGVKVYVWMAFNKVGPCQKTFSLEFKCYEKDLNTTPIWTTTISDFNVSKE